MVWMQLHNGMKWYWYCVNSFLPWWFDTGTISYRYHVNIVSIFLTFLYSCMLTTCNRLCIFVCRNRWALDSLLYSSFLKCSQHDYMCANLFPSYFCRPYCKRLLMLFILACQLLWFTSKNNNALILQSLSMAFVSILMFNRLELS